MWYVFGRDPMPHKNSNLQSEWNPPFPLSVRDIGHLRRATRSHSFSRWSPMRYFTEDISQGLQCCRQLLTCQEPIYVTGKLQRLHIAEIGVARGAREKCWRGALMISSLEKSPARGAPVNRVPRSTYCNSSSPHYSSSLQLGTAGREQYQLPADFALQNAGSTPMIGPQ